MTTTSRCLKTCFVFAALALASGCGLSSSSSPSKPTPEEIAKLREAQRSNAPLLDRFGPQGPFRQWDLRETTIDAIARIGESAVPLLIESLNDPNPLVRTQSARALARMGPPAASAVPALTAALHDKDEMVRQAAVRALGQMGPAAAPAVPELIDILRQSDAPPATAAKTPS